MPLALPAVQADHLAGRGRGLCRIGEAVAEVMAGYDLAVEIGSLEIGPSGCLVEEFAYPAEMDFLACAALR